MANMSYCRFRNTVKDLKDCYEHMEDKVGEEEERARQKLIEVCRNIVDDYEEDEEEEEEEEIEEEEEEEEKEEIKR